MWHIGVDLHRETIVAAAVDDAGQVRPPVRFACADTPAIRAYFEQLRPFQVMIEATGSKQGSPYLRWVLVEAGMKFVASDVPAANFYQRIRKRSGVKIARVAIGRKLAEICFKRLLRWHREHASSSMAAA